MTRNRQGLKVENFSSESDGENVIGKRNEDDVGSIAKTTLAGLCVAERKCLSSARVALRCAWPIVWLFTTEQNLDCLALLGWLNTQRNFKVQTLTQRRSDQSPDQASMMSRS